MWEGVVCINGTPEVPNNFPYVGTNSKIKYPVAGLNMYSPMED